MEVQTIPEQLLFSTVRIETDLGVGTGFILQVKINIGGSMIFLITNKHVIKDAKKISFFFTKAGLKTLSEEEKKTFYKKIKSFLTRPEDEKNNVRDYPLIGEKLQLEINGEKWFEHPDAKIDLTLINISLALNNMEKNGNRIFIRSIPADLIPSKEFLQELDALENVIFIGYPNGIYDRKNLLPITRTGMTATPIYEDYEGEPQFLIDASVFPGSSGSPVFIYDKNGYKDKKGNTYMGSERIIFCGVISSTLIRTDSGRLEFIEVPTKVLPMIETSQMIDLGVVIKSEKVKELVELYLNHLNEENRRRFEPQKEFNEVNK